MAVRLNSSYEGEFSSSEDGGEDEKQGGEGEEEDDKKAHGHDQEEGYPSTPKVRLRRLVSSSTSVP